MSALPRPIPPNPPRWQPSSDLESIVTPGLDTEASAIEQIEQIEQLITIKLQNIDENFAKIQNVLANKVLPAVKRYSIGTEPVREAAKFWTEFYEHAAQVNIPTYGDHSTVNELSSEDNSQNASAPQDGTVENVEDTIPPEMHEISGSTETSFMPGQAAFSSTPATVRLAASSHQSFASQASEDPSWSQSMNSPLMRLSKDLKSFTAQSHANQSTTQPDSVLDVTIRDTSSIPHSSKGKGKETSHPLLQNVLRHNLYTASDNSSFEIKNTSPLKLRGNSKTPLIDKKLNPYLPADGTTSSSDWSGVVDLRDAAVRTPQHHWTGKSKVNTNKVGTLGEDEDGDDSFDALPPGMSPPVLMSPARPARYSVGLGPKIGQTPVREASSRIQSDLLRSALRSAKKQVSLGFDSSMSTLPTPPSFSRYGKDSFSSGTGATRDPSLESMIKHIKNDIEGFSKISDPLPSHASQARSTTGSYPAPFHSGYASPTPVYDPYLDQGQDDSLDSDLDEVNDTANPSAAFLMASQQGDVYEDGFSLDSNRSTDSLADEDSQVPPSDIVPHPFASANAVVDDGFDDDDSFDDGFQVGSGGIGGAVDEEETVFGLAPMQRQGYGTRFDGQGLRMLGEGLLEDTIGIGAQIQANGRVEESPTPAAWNR